ncbi:DNA polymerase III subunit gamma/tau [Arsenicibacter rosenii]|uniref:DNA polymerase III subunit gamma/tau n=1 Tax=Arsenicibacter rosenii TaxID=1750698 RepID=A0A1S2VIZ9_9BACT|nr:DNA polymerase III subunit gamma/tau [Arsenicibacter rosenii]OIN58719.1 DNA polymerase III, subunit gamma and tau [Arsenicibacter rosenii]
MENFVVSARKYRPATFDTVVGQEHITTTLRNAIRTNHLAQAFLFCGPRGVGKTTCARILAKTINCQNLTPDIEACDECESCVSFKQNASFNIHELDAASNNSVEDIRNLIDQVRYPPQSGQYKIYIIDEVHMLSQAAFNAFLKTLEEPPSYAIFILATTEKHKILPTILSRCQIFDFNRIQPKDIADHLGRIAQKEDISVEYDALELIAQKADGGLRDALSMFDLNVTFSTDRTLRYKEVLDNLHILDYDYYFRLTDALLEGNLTKTLLTLDEILRKGFDAHQFVVGLSRHFRDLLVCKDSATVQLLQVTETVKAKYLAQSANAPMSFLLSALSIGGQCDMNYKQAKDQRLHVELCLMKLANLRHVLNWDAMPELPLNGSSGGTTIPAADLSTVAVPAAAEKKNDNGHAIARPTPVETPSVLPPGGYTSEPVNGYGRSTIPAPEKTTAGSVVATSVAVTDSVVLEKPVIQRPASSRLRSTVSLNSKPQAAEQQQAEQQTISSSRPDKPFNFDALQRTWHAFARLRKQQFDSMSEELMFNREITLEGTTVHIALDNNIQANLMVDLKPELLAYLRDQLQNKQIQVEHRVVVPDTKKMIYTPQDRFNYLAAKNPALLDLRNALNLDVDF